MDEVLAAFEDAGAAIAPIYDVEQLLIDPHVIARDTITTIKDEDLGTLKMQNLMLRLADTPGGIHWPGRRLGQDNTEVFAELGLSEEELAALRDKGVI